MPLLHLAPIEVAPTPPPPPVPPVRRLSNGEPELPLDANHFQMCRASVVQLRDLDARRRASKPHSSGWHYFPPNVVMLGICWPETFLPHHELLAAVGSSMETSFNDHTTFDPSVQDKPRLGEPGRLFRGPRFERVLLWFGRKVFRIVSLERRP